MISIGTEYFAVELPSIVLNFFNSVYIAVERARGNSKLILRINVLVLVIKLILTAVFIYILNGGIIMIAAANLISQGIFFIIAVKNMNDRNSPFGNVKSGLSRRASWGSWEFLPLPPW